MGLFLRCHRRHKSGTDYAYWSVVENHRSVAGKVVQRQVLYLGELTQTQQAAWQRLSEQIEPSSPAAPALPGLLTSMAAPAAPLPKIDFSGFSLHHPRQWGACWVADRMWRDLQLEDFWRPRLPLGREVVMAGNTQNKATLVGFLKKIRRRYGKARRNWIVDRGIPTEETLALMRKPRHRISYLVGTPKGQLSRLEARFAERPWQAVRSSVCVKLLPQTGEVLVFVESADRIGKERSMRKRKLQQLVERLKELRA